MSVTEISTLNFDPDEEINSLPAEVPADEHVSIMAVDDYHNELTNRSQLRRKIYLKWDVSNGFWKNGDDMVDGGKPIVATIFQANFPWQYWDNMQLVCQNMNPGGSPQLGEWKELDGKITMRACATCPKNSRSKNFESGKDKKTCKDAMQIAMSVMLNGEEKVVGFQTSNFKLINDFDDFLDVLKANKARLSTTTIQIGKGKPITINNKKMFGWELKIVAKTPLAEYMKTLNN